MSRTIFNLTTGLEYSERVTVAFLVAVGAAVPGRMTLMDRNNAELLTEGNDAYQPG